MILTSAKTFFTESDHWIDLVYRLQCPLCTYIFKHIFVPIYKGPRKKKSARKRFNT